MKSINILYYINKLCTRISLWFSYKISDWSEKNTFGSTAYVNCRTRNQCMPEVVIFCTQSHNYTAENQSNNIGTIGI